MDPAALDHIQQVIDDETPERFGTGPAPRLVLLQHGDHPGVEPGELYLQVVIGAGDAPWGEWTEGQRGRIWDFREQRLPEVRGVMVTTETPDADGRRPTATMKIDSDSLLDPENVERALGFSPVMAHLGPQDLATLDTLVVAGIAGSRSEATRWALARVREQPAYTELGEQARPAGLERAAQSRLQAELAEQVKQRFPGGEVQRVALLQYGDDPWIEPGDLLVRVFVAAAEEEPDLPAWEKQHAAISLDLHRVLAERVPAVRFLEFWFGDAGQQGQSRQRLGGPPDAPACRERERDLTVVDVKLGPADREMLDTLIAAGVAGRRAEAIGWALDRIRERPGYARLGERARELDDLKARF